MKAETDGAPARFLLACWPFAGHISPYMALALALRERGHDVAFYSGESLRSTIESESFAFFPFQQVSEERAEASMQAMDTAAPSGRPEGGLVLRTFQEWLVETIPAQVADMESILATWKPDVVVTETAMWGPILVLWERTGTPVAILSTLLGCLVPGSDAPPAGLGLPPPRNLGGRMVARGLQSAITLLGIGLRRRVDEIRADYGLPPLGCPVTEFTGKLPLYLIGSLPELDYNRRDLPESVHYIGPCVWHPPAQAEVPEWLENLSTDRPWVHVTESTLSYGDPFVLRAAAQGLADLDAEVILTTGTQRDPHDLDLGPLAPNIHVARWINHSDLLPRCSVLVTTGGAGTIMASLQAETPLVVVPTTWDKPDNARRVVEAGVGARLAPKRCTPENMRDVVERVLTRPGYRDNARRLAGQLRAAPGPVGAVDLLERLVPAPVMTA